MRIGIDARFLTHPQAGGFKTYTKNLIAALAAIDERNEYILYLDRSPTSPFPLPDRPNFTHRIISGSLPLLGMPWREQVGLARHAARDRLDLFHAPSLTAPLRLSCPLVVTIHDMIWYFPTKYTNDQRSFGKRTFMNWYYYVVPKQAAHRARAVITVSHAAKAGIIEQLGISSTRIFVTHEAAGHTFQPLKTPEKLTAIRQKYHLPPVFILAIGSADPRKNITTLVSAYAQLPESLRQKHHLAIVWTHNRLADGLVRQAEAWGCRHQLHFIDHISDDSLAQLYNAASLFVFPSLYEGFGLPPLEAMACGTPVIAANNSSIPEIVGDAAVLVNAQNAEAIAQAMSTVLNSQTRQRELAEKGLHHAANFSWQKCGTETLEVYHQVYTAEQRRQYSNDSIP